MLVQRASPLLGERRRVLGPERTDRPSSRREVLREEGLDLLAVRLGLGGIGRLHAGHGTAFPAPRPAGRSAAASVLALGRHSRRSTSRASRRPYAWCRSRWRLAATCVDPRGGAHERSVASESRGHDACAARELEPGDAVELGLSRGEERLTEAERNRTGDDGEPEVEQVDHRAHGPPDERAGALDDLAATLRLGARPVMARMAVPDASASRQPRAPHAHNRPSGTTIT